MFKQYKLKNYHFQLIIYLGLLTGLGILVIGSAEESVQNKQILGFIMGMVVMIAISLMDYSFILRFCSSRIPLPSCHSLLWKFLDRAQFPPPMP